MKRFIKFISLIICLTMVMSTCVYAADPGEKAGVAEAAEDKAAFSAQDDTAETYGASDTEAAEYDAAYDTGSEAFSAADEEDPAEPSSEQDGADANAGRDGSGSDTDDDTASEEADPGTEDGTDDPEDEDMPGEDQTAEDTDEDTAEGEPSAEDPEDEDTEDQKAADDEDQENISDPEADPQEGSSDPESDDPEKDPEGSTEDIPEDDTEDTAEDIADEDDPEEDVKEKPEETSDTDDEKPSDSEPDKDKPEKDKTKTEEETEAKDALGTAVNILSSNADFGKFTVSVTGVPESAVKVKLAVWCSADRSDKRWYKAVNAGNGTYTATVYKYLHADHTGTYQARAYVYFSDGSREYAGKQSFTVNNPSPFIKVSAGGGEYDFTVRYVQNASQVSCVKFAVWSENGGQDDLNWYKGTFSKQNVSAYLTSTLSKHADSGTYFVHAYAYTRSGESFFITGTTFTVDRSTVLTDSGVTIKTSNKTGNFRISAKVTGGKKTVKKVKIAVYGRSDKSDLVWYSAADKGKGIYAIAGNIKKHNYYTGKYTARIKAFYTDGTTKIVSTVYFKISESSGKIIVQGNDTDTKYVVTVQNLTIPAGAKKVRMAVWSEAYGQDDIVWYKLSGINGKNYTGTVAIKNHRTAGYYSVHVYYTALNGEERFIKASGFSVNPRASINVTVSGREDGDSWFKAALSIAGSSSACRLTKAAVWCSDDMSDIVWYPISANSKGNYLVRVCTANHYGNTGKYHFRIYAKFSNGIETEVKTFSRNFDPESYLIVTKSKGTCRRMIKYVNRNVSSVKFKVWSEVGGAYDTKVYKAKVNSHGTFYATVNMDHFSHDGKYYIQVISGSSVLDSGSFIMIDYLEQAIKYAYDDSIGYSQYHRDLNPDLDCSSLVYYSLKVMGYTVPGYAFSTYSMTSDLQNAGFTLINYTNVTDLQPGDILLRNGHTEIYAGNGLTVGAHQDEVGDIVGRNPGDQTGLEVCVSPISENWLYAFRYRTYTS